MREHDPTRPKKRKYFAALRDRKHLAGASPRIAGGAVEEPLPDEGPKRGFHLLPNLITSAGLFCGFWAITESFIGHYVTAAWLIILAGVFDGLDGKVARLTGTASEFGVEYDSLADLVSFGVAPGVLAFTWALHYAFIPKIGWTMATMFVVCGALRLARFNVQFDPAEKKYMKGLAIPAAASGLSVTVLFFAEMGWVNQAGRAEYPNLVLLFVVLISFLMISTIKYYSFKDVDLFRRRPLWTLLAIILVTLIIVVWKERTLFILFLVYMVSGPAMHLLRRPTAAGEEDSLIE